MKKFFLFNTLLFILCVGMFSFEYKVQKNEENDWIFETSFPQLFQNKIWEEIQIQNNSTLNLNHITCSVIIKGKEHNMKTVTSIKSGDKEEFEGYEDNEMKDEFAFYFGDAGKFNKYNHNKITFKINFKENRDDVIISTVYMNDKHLLFIIEDSPDRHVETESEALERTGSQVIVIDGKKYLLYDGVAYPVN